MSDRMTTQGRRPTHPGEMLREEFMPDFGLTVAQLALRIGVSRRTVNQLVHAGTWYRRVIWHLKKMGNK